jgi:soluble lytic murein transglycosylase-like protein
MLAMRLLTASFWLLLSAVGPVPAILAQTATPEKGPATPAPQAAPAATPSAMEAAARKQREATLAAMQASIDKQRAALGGGSGNAPRSFFNLPPLPPAENKPVWPDGGLANRVAYLDCDPLPEAQVAPIFLEAAQREGLEPGLLSAVIKQESGFRPCAISQKGAQGLMQLMPETVDQLGIKDPFDVKQNIDGGAKFLKELITRYSGDLSLALGAYNAGAGKVDAAGGAIPPIAETEAYVKEILSNMKAQHAQPNPPQLAKP